ncbi:translation initiation factor IF-2-like [Molothrus ater]|uniref:translation initiation factor IF-2-like n=1 Tax=Molothrus ater TaxID=84834 RepID=UPI001749CC38|nr:translation initiation factor IF-2-like [Molothrus ater]
MAPTTRLCSNSQQGDNGAEPASSKLRVRTAFKSFRLKAPRHCPSARDSIPSSSRAPSPHSSLSPGTGAVPAAAPCPPRPPRRYHGPGPARRSPGPGPCTCASPARRPPPARLRPQPPANSGPLRRLPRCHPREAGPAGSPAPGPCGAWAVSARPRPSLLPRREEKAAGPRGARSLPGGAPAARRVRCLPRRRGPSPGPGPAAQPRPPSLPVCPAFPGARRRCGARRGCGRCWLGLRCAPPRAGRRRPPPPPGRALGAPPAARTCWSRRPPARVTALGRAGRGQAHPARPIPPPIGRRPRRHSPPSLSLVDAGAAHTQAPPKSFSLIGSSSPALVTIGCSSRQSRRQRTDSVFLRTFFFPASQPRAGLTEAAVSERPRPSQPPSRRHIPSLPAARFACRLLAPSAATPAASLALAAASPRGREPTRGALFLIGRCSCQSSAAGGAAERGPARAPSRSARRLVAGRTRGARPPPCPTGGQWEVPVCARDYITTSQSERAGAGVPPEGGGAWRPRRDPLHLARPGGAGAGISGCCRCRPGLLLLPHQRARLEVSRSSAFPSARGARVPCPGSGILGPRPHSCARVSRLGVAPGTPPSPADTGAA